MGLHAFTILAYESQGLGSGLYALLVEAYKDKSFRNPKVQHMWQKLVLQVIQEAAPLAAV